VFVLLLLPPPPPPPPPLPLLLLLPGCGGCRCAKGHGARFTVGEETRAWTPGSASCFDDSFVHHAEHPGSHDRYILLVDIPHPQLAGALASTPASTPGHLLMSS
jgi:hypothetical protein